MALVSRGRVEGQERNEGEMANESMRRGQGEGAHRERGQERLILEGTL